MEFKELQGEELTRVQRALRSNAETGAPVFMGKDTRLTDAHDEETVALINAIKSVPCHYAGMTGIQLIRDFFSIDGKPPTMEEMKKLTKEDRDELTAAIAAQRGLRKGDDGMYS